MADGIRRMERVVDDVKELINKTLTPMQVIEEPESAIIVNTAFDMMEAYIQLEKEKTELLQKNHCTVRSYIFSSSKGDFQNDCSTEKRNE